MNSFTFDRGSEPLAQPAISVICINKNHGEYLEDTILSVLAQKFDDFEFIIADGGSTDNSLELIDKYKFITLVTGRDTSRGDGLNRALAAARGRYVMITTSTDGYLSRDWLRSAAAVLDQDPQVSLVFGACALMSGAGTLGPVTWPNSYPFHEVPSKVDMAGVWLQHGFAPSYLPELNYCVRIDIFRQCFGPSENYPALNDIDPVLRMHFEFFRQGYLTQYLPITANFGRTHPNQEQLTENNQRYLRTYDAAWQNYRDEVAAGRKVHLLRDGSGVPFVQLNWTA